MSRMMREKRSTPTHSFVAACSPHGLARRRFDTEENVLEWMLAMQAQERSVAPWSFGQRARDGSESDVLRAIVDGPIVRTHVLRPTWHYVHAADARWLLELSAPRVHATNRHYRSVGLDRRGACPRC
jgi:hypothetical protein